MALKSTVFKADLGVADMDRGYYGDHSLTLARHPSETDERLMVRLLAFALNADERLEFGRGISTDDEADLWRLDLTGAIEQWIDVGLPDERDIRKASNRANEVVLYTYGGRAAEIWWEQNQNKLARLDNLTVVNLAAAETQALATLAARTMRLQVTIQDGHLYVAGEGDPVEVTPVFWKRPRG
ncbi:YaeQ family protein [Oryzomicrobium sp.]|uniref:YaeQ family protein n=1 Tax=Oryzomicrobium sp. TaxID=1911578 RepID=UPI002FE090D7